MRALITGGAGFIGSHLAETLLLQGHSVTVVDDLSTGRPENIAHLRDNPSFEWVIDTVTNRRLVQQLVDRSDLVFHLAAAVGVKLVCEAPIHTIANNVNGTETVLEAASRNRTPVLVASTSEVYGKSLALPYREDADLVLGPPAKTRWGYATSKLIDEFMAMAYWKERGVPAVIVRLFNTVGPRQSERYGMVIPNFVKHALLDEPIVVHGDGSQTRSFTWVGDVVWALTTLMGDRRTVGEVFNVGNGDEISIVELALRVKAMTGSRSEIVFAPYEQVFDNSFEDMPRRVPDIRKIRAAIGFEPKVRLDGILKYVIEYWKPRVNRSMLTRGLTRLAPQPGLHPAAAKGTTALTAALDVA
jgi:nucleoside-diphosphate-sugar epimerase